MQKLLKVPLIYKLKVNKREIGLCHITKETKIGSSRNFIFDTVENVISYFKEGKISSFDFIMYINIISNRSYNDLTQYPIMPWVILDSNSKKLPKLTKPLPTCI